MDSQKNVQGASQKMGVMQTVTGYAFSFVVKAAIEVGVFNELKRGFHTIDEMSENLKVNTSALRRLMRALACINLVVEETPGVFKATGSGESFQSGNQGSMEPLAKYMLNDKLVSAMMGLTYSVQTGKSSFENINGMSWYEYGKENPGCLKIMDKAMENYSKVSLETLLEAYPFSKFGLIVDIGGGNGQILSEILKENPNSNGILFDQEATIARVNEDPKLYGLDHRCELVAGDMFDKIPAGGDLYLISKVLNDWEDDEVISILKNVKSEMTKESRLIIIESIDKDSKYSPEDIFRDLLFLTLSAGKVRNEREFVKLIKAAGLDVIDVKLRDDRFSIIECKLSQ